MSKHLKPLDDLFASELRDPEFARDYLQLALEENGPEGFFFALQKVAAANRSMSKVATEAGVGRESLYRSLSEQGNPSFRTIYAALRTLGMELRVDEVKASSPSSLP